MAATSERLYDADGDDRMVWVPAVPEPYRGYRIFPWPGEVLTCVAGVRPDYAPEYQLRCGKRFTGRGRRLAYERHFVAAHVDLRPGAPKRSTSMQISVRRARELGYLWDAAGELVHDPMKAGA